MAKRATGQTKKTKAENQLAAQTTALTESSIVAEIALYAAQKEGREELRLLFERTIGDQGITFAALSDAAESTSNSKKFGIDSTRADQISTGVDFVCRPTTAREREKWLGLVALFDQMHQKMLERAREANQKSAFGAADDKPAATEPNASQSAASEISQVSDFSFVLKDTAQVIQTLRQLARQREDLSGDSVVARLGGLLINNFEFLSEAFQIEPAKNRQLVPKLSPLAPDGFLRTPANRIAQSTIEAFMPGALKRGAEAEEILERFESKGLHEKFWAVHPIESKRNDLYGLGGFLRNPGEALWELLQTKGDLAIRAQFALWARAFQESNAEPGKMIKISINQFCDDVGYARHKGAHKRENKRSAVQILELITSFEISLVWKSPKGNWVRIRGPIWLRAGVGEESDEYGDLFGSTKIGDPDFWDPTAFAFAPGFLFDNEEWRQYNQAVAMVGQGLLTLSAHERDKWAVLIGGYIALQARFGDYLPKRFRLKTLLDKTGLSSQLENRHGARAVDKIESALDRLKEVNVIAEWKYTDEDETDPSVDYDDLSQAKTLQTLADQSKSRRNVRQELDRVVEITWTNALAAHSMRLIAGRAASGEMPALPQLSAAVPKKKRASKKEDRTR